MKKGCFLTVIVVLTIILIAVFYLVSNHGEELINAGKNKLVEFAQTKIIDDIDNLESVEYSDSLKQVVIKYFKDIDKLDIKVELNRLEEFSDDMEVIFMDGEIDSAEFDFITNILVKYEERKEDRN